MAQTVFKRQLIGQQSGVQVNLPRDTTDRLLADVGNQSFAAVGRFSRGRIDRAFQVAASKLTRYLGVPKSMRANAANETYTQIFEALNHGSASVIVSRISSNQAVNKWIVVKHGSTALELLESAPSMVVMQHTEPLESVPRSDNTWLLAFRIMDCIDEGVHVTVTKGDAADELSVIVRERSLDSFGNETSNGEILYDFTGSLKTDAKDDMGESYYIADVAAKYYGDWVQIETNSTTTEVTDQDVLHTKAAVQMLKPYSDTGTPSTENYASAANALGKTSLPYRYILSESSNTKIVNTLLGVAQKYNRIMMQEISGSLKPEAAISWKNTFNYDAQGGMYCLWIWSPIERQDSTGATGIFQYGTVGQKIGYACARNAITNGFGLPALNQPIAGKNYMISGTRITQLQEPDDVELAALAKAHINPVLFAEYHDGSGYVWDDSLSGAKRNGVSKLENAVEVSQWVQERFGKYARSLLQTPMSEAIRKMQRFAEDEFQAMQASVWLTPSTQLSGRAYSYMITPSERNPEDELQVTLNLAIDGVVRRIFISQNMYSRS